MGDRVVLGKKGSDYGIWISNPSAEADSDADKDMLMSSTSPTVGQVILFQKLDVNGNGTATLDYKNFGGVKTFISWWTNEDYLDGGTDDKYTSDGGFGGVLVTVANAYVNSTTNRITATNLTAQSRSVIVMVFKEAAA
jgi:hypothetical protein